MTDDALTEKVALLPCPFCGSDDIDPEGIAGTKGGGETVVSGPCCNVCSAATTFTGNPGHDAALWNRRAAIRQHDAESAMLTAAQEATTDD